MGSAGIELWITRCQVQDSVVQPSPLIYNRAVYDTYQMDLVSHFWFFD